LVHLGVDFQRGGRVLEEGEENLKYGYASSKRGGALFMFGTHLMAEDFLLATHAAMMEFAPDLKEHVEILLKEGETVSEQGGKKVALKFVVKMNPSDAEAILRALKIVQDNEGYDRIFNKIPVNLLVATWTWHAQRLRDAE
jgi:hypothetical protein